jgi:heme/copper-type cytochrome/quinol oxidase subunit 2
MQYHSQGPDQAALLAGGVGLLITILFVVAMVVLTVVIWWKIFSKAGYSGAMSLLMLLPVVNFIMLLVLAFGQWPIHRELAALKQLAQRPQP